MVSIDQNSLNTPVQFEKKDSIFSALLFLIALSVFIKSRFIVSWDLSQYLVIAENFSTKWELLNSFGQIEMIRVGFIFFLSLVLKISGGTLHFVHYSIAVVSALMIPLTYILGVIIRNRIVGIFASLLCLTTPEIVKWAPRHIDAFWTVLLLISMILLLHGRSDGWGKGCFAGVAAAFAIFVKPVALLFLAFPVLYRVRIPEKSYKREICFYTIVFFLMFLLRQWTDEFGLLDKAQSDTFYLPFTLLKDFPSLRGIINFISCSLYGLWGYFFPTVRGAGLLNNFPFAIVLYFCVFSTGVMGAIKRDKLFSLLLVFISFSPFLSLCGLYDLRLPQFLLGYILGFIALSVVVASLLNSVSNKLKFLNNTRWYIFLPVLGCLIVLANWSSRLKFKVVYNNTLIGSQFSQKGFQNYIVLRGSQLYRWFAKNLNGGDSVMVSDIPSANGVYIEGRGAFPAFYLPYTVIGDEITVSYFPSLLPKNTGNYFVNLFGRPESPQSAVLILNSGILYEYMGQNSIQYLAVSNHEKDLMKFLDSLSWLIFETKVKDFHPFSVYKKVEKTAVDEGNNIVFSKKSRLFLKDLKEKHPDRYQWFLDKLCFVKNEEKI